METRRKDRIQSSRQWNKTRFQNPDPVPPLDFAEMLSTAREYYFNKPRESIPDVLLPAQPLDLPTGPAGKVLQLVWLGHTTFLIEIEGIKILTDPMFSTRAGPFGLLGPKRYAQMATSVEELPHLDVVLITHDHYDHLDRASIQSLIPRTDRFIAPLGVGALLEQWGVDPQKLIELDWWEDTTIQSVKITSTPARHFSGRGFFDKNKTLWSSYSIRAEKASLYLSGDSGWHDQLYEIGKRLGPFDVAIIEIGAYGKPKGWKEVHFTPEEAIRAHLAVKGKVLIPEHWATFDLAMFPWHEPIERFISAANEAGVNYLTPAIGERINPSHVGGRSQWWRPYIEPDQRKQ